MSKTEEFNEVEATSEKKRGRKPQEPKPPATTEGMITEQGPQVTVSIPERDESGEMVFIDDVLQRRYTTVSRELAEEQIELWAAYEHAYKKDSNTKVPKGNPHWRGARIEK
jgi:hypothetical protein